MNAPPVASPTLVTDWRAVPAALRGATVALGNMDGVHRGHLAVLRAAHAARPAAPLACCPQPEDAACQPPRT